MSDPIPLSDLSDDSLLRIHAADPALGPDAAGQLRGSLDKLLRQFVAEGAVSAAATDIQQDGRFVLIAWQEGTGEGLSGCRKDKLAKVLAKAERDHHVSLLDTPQLVVEVDGVIQCLDRKGLRPLAAAGRVTSTSCMWDLRCATLGAWRASASKPIGESWMAPILARMWQSTAAFPSQR